MTTWEAEQRVRLVEASVNNPKVAQVHEDTLHIDVLRAVAEGAINARELAEIALRTDEIDFPTLVLMSGQALPTPEEVHAYLSGRGWTVHESADERGDGFRLYEHPHPALPGTRIGIWVPQRPAAADYRRRLFEALSSVGRLERRLSVPEQVARDCTAKPPTTPVGDADAR